MFIADYDSYVVRKVSASGRITRFAGAYEPLTSSLGYTGPATSANLLPAGLAVDASGNLFIADNYNAIREVFLDTAIPVVSAGGIVNAASLDSQVLAPGEVVSVFGIGLGPESGQATAVTGG